MAKKNNIRSQYIKDLMADKESLSEQLTNNTKDSLRALLEETVNETLRGILNEADDKDYDEEEINTDSSTDAGIESTPETSTDDASSDATATDDSVDAGSSDVTTDDTTVIDGEGSDADAEASTDGETGSEDMWGELEQYKGEDDEYDLTGMGSEDVIKVLKVMGPEDNVRIVKNDNGTLTLSDDETDKEYIIDLDGSMTGNTDDAAAATDGVDDATTDITDDLNEELGYTDNYQNKTAMTTPSNNEPGKNVNTWDDGIPTGTEKPWVGNKGDMAPFDKNVNEGEKCSKCGNNPCTCNENDDECVFEIEVPETDTSVEESTTVAGGAHVKGMVGDSNHSKEAAQRHIHKSGEGAHPEALTNESKQMQNLIRKAEAVMNENKQLKEIAKSLKEEVERAVVINTSLASIINLVTENSTTRNEKINILERFNQVKTVEESRALYESISKELKNSHSVNDTSKLINNQIVEAKNTDKKSQIVETSMLKSESLNETIDFMRRLSKIK